MVLYMVINGAYWSVFIEQIFSNIAQIFFIANNI